jgi:CRISPR system Cascade subunit CasB
MSRPFDADRPAGKALFRWWASLEDNRADRAELKRCEDLLEVMITPAFQRARRILLAAGLNPRGAQQDRLAMVVGLSASVSSTRDPNAHSRLPRLPLAFSEGEKPSVSPLRFRQLLEARTDDELFVRLRRVLPLVKERINLFHLANDVFQWNDIVRKGWIYEYLWPEKQTV